MVDLCNALNEGIQKGLGGPVNIYHEYTGLDRFKGAAYERSLLAHYNEGYGKTCPDLIVAVGPTALDFLSASRFLPETPAVACYVTKSLVEKARAQRPNLTGAYPSQGAKKTIQLMLNLYPKTRRIHVVLGASEYERGQAEVGRQIFAEFQNRVAFDYWNDLTLPEMLQQARQHKEDELILFGSLLRDAAGTEFPTNLGLIQLAAASRRPIFGTVAEDIGSGILGGVLVSMQASGKVSAELSVRILKGESAAGIPLMADKGMAPTFDARQLQRWGLKDGQLPSGSVILFRKPTLWDAYWKEISLGLGIIAVESLLVAGLVFLLIRKRRYERELSEARTRYRTVADHTLAWEFWQMPDGRFSYVSPACERLSGYPPEAFLEDPALLERLVAEGDREAWRTHLQAALEGRTPPPLEFQLIDRNGQPRWIEQGANPVRIEGQPQAGSRGSLRDISDRKAGELALKAALDKITALTDRLEAENTYYREKIQVELGPSEILGQSDPIKYLHYRIAQVAQSDTTVLIQGATGTGKELVAEAIHKLGPRKDKPLVKINCAALPQGLAESELFGHERGAFTGAQNRRRGRFEVAHGATLFLDEIGELSPEIQAKLLRVLQNGELQRVGGDETLTVDVRVLAATNRDLEAEVRAGRFREDLWYRLNVFHITVPPLALRREDIPTLTQAFVRRSCTRLGRPELDIPNAALQALQAYDWPGNVRELQNVIEHAVIISEGSTLRLDPRFQASSPAAPAPEGPRTLATLEEMERQHIQAALGLAKGKVSGGGGAAEILGLKPTTLRSRMEKLGIAKG